MLHKGYVLYEQGMAKQAHGTGQGNSEEKKYSSEKKLPVMYIQTYFGKIRNRIIDKEFEWGHCGSLIHSFHKNKFKSNATTI